MTSSITPSDAVGCLILVTIVFILIFHVAMNINHRPKGPKDKSDNE